MNKTNHLTIQLLKLLSFSFLFVQFSSAADGIAVSVAYRYSEMNKYSSSPNSKLVPESFNNESGCYGKIVRFLISKNRVSKTDTICHFISGDPKLSFDGTQVVFPRTSTTLGKDGKLVGSLADAKYISVIDTDGKNLRNLVQISKLYGTAPEHRLKLAWPKGDWIYYENPNKGKGEIWKVNVNDTSKKELVFDYFPSDSGRTDFLRWSLSANAKFALSGLIGGKWDGNRPHCFPPRNGEISLCSPGEIDYFSVSLSPSANFLASYKTGIHNSISVYDWNHSINSARVTTSVRLDSAWKWIGDSSGTYGDWTSFSVNSDKWVLQQVSWGNAQIKSGSNMLLINWKDKVAIQVTNNERNTDNAAKSISYNNTSGDFHLSHVPASKIETATGEFIEVGNPTGLDAFRKSIQNKSGLKNWKKCWSDDFKGNGQKR